jgi:predicted NUDIX family NTP pyrophosphohydrolase
MPKQAAGLLMYRFQQGRLEFLLVHPGGPFWKSKDAGAWSIPKGEIEPGEDPLAAARREFLEELGTTCQGEFLPLSPIQQKNGKVVQAWAVEGTCETAKITSNTFEMEWPPKSGRMQQFPEVDRAEFFPFEVALEKINPAQVPLLQELQRKLSGGKPGL